MDYTTDQRCRQVCPWAYGCSCCDDNNPELCPTAKFLERFWKTPEAMNDYLEKDRMRHKYEMEEVE